MSDVQEQAVLKGVFEAPMCTEHVETAVARIVVTAQEADRANLGTMQRAFAACRIIPHHHGDMTVLVDQGLTFS